MRMVCLQRAAGTPLRMALMAAFLLCLTNASSPFSSLSFAHAAIISSSQMQYCTNDGSESIPCDKKFVVSLSIDGDQDDTETVSYWRSGLDVDGKTLNLKDMLSISVAKSKPMVRYPIVYEGTYNSNPTELLTGSSSLCATGNDLCPLDHSIVGSPRTGFCCDCDLCSYLGCNSAAFRLSTINCNAFKFNSGKACLKMGDLYYSAYSLQPAETWYTITVTIRKGAVAGGGEQGTVVATLQLGPDVLGRSDPSSGVSARLVGDFAKFKEAPTFASKLLFAPTAPVDHPRTMVKPPAKEFMLLEKTYVTYDGSECNKIGVNYDGFKNQGDRCLRLTGSCTGNQIDALRASDAEKKANGLAGRFMVENFGDFVYLQPDGTESTSTWGRGFAGAAADGDGNGNGEVPVASGPNYSDAAVIRNSTTTATKALTAALSPSPPPYDEGTRYGLGRETYGATTCSVYSDPMLPFHPQDMFMRSYYTQLKLDRQRERDEQRRASSSLLFFKEHSAKQGRERRGRNASDEQLPTLDFDDGDDDAFLSFAAMEASVIARRDGLPSPSQGGAAAGRHFRPAATTASSSSGGGGTSPYLAYRQSGVQASLITLTFIADKMAFVVNVASGKLIAYNVSAFEANSRNGKLVVKIFNTGNVTADFQLSVTGCSEGTFPIAATVASIPAKTVVEQTINIYSANINGVDENSCSIVLYNSLFEQADSGVVKWTTTVQGTEGPQSGGGWLGGGTAPTNANGAGEAEEDCYDCPFYNPICFIGRSCFLAIVGQVIFVIVIIAGVVLAIRFRHILYAVIKFVFTSIRGKKKSKRKRRRTRDSDDDESSSSGEEEEEDSGKKKKKGKAITSPVPVAAAAVAPSPNHHHHHRLPQQQQSTAMYPSVHDNLQHYYALGRKSNNNNAAASASSPQHFPQSHPWCHQQQKKLSIQTDDDDASEEEEEDDFDGDDPHNGPIPYRNQALHAALMAYRCPWTVTSNQRGRVATARHDVNTANAAGGGLSPTARGHQQPPPSHSPRHQSKQRAESISIDHGGDYDDYYYMYDDDDCYPTPPATPSGRRYASYGAVYKHDPPHVAAFLAAQQKLRSDRRREGGDATTTTTTRDGGNTNGGAVIAAVPSSSSPSPQQKRRKSVVKRRLSDGAPSFSSLPHVNVNAKHSRAAAACGSLVVYDAATGGKVAVRKGGEVTDRRDPNAATPNSRRRARGGDAVGEGPSGRKARRTSTVGGNGGRGGKSTANAPDQDDDDGEEEGSPLPRSPQPHQQQGRRDKQPLQYFAPCFGFDDGDGATYNGRERDAGEDGNYRSDARRDDNAAVRLLPYQYNPSAQHGLLATHQHRRGTAAEVQHLHVAAGHRALVVHDTHHHHNHHHNHHHGGRRGTVLLQRNTAGLRDDDDDDDDADGDDRRHHNRDHLSSKKQHHGRNLHPPSTHVGDGMALGPQNSLVKWWGGAGNTISATHLLRDDDHDHDYKYDEDASARSKKKGKNGRKQPPSRRPDTTILMLTFDADAMDQLTTTSTMGRARHTAMNTTTTTTTTMMDGLGAGGDGCLALRRRKGFKPTHEAMSDVTLAVSWHNDDESPQLAAPHTAIMAAGRSNAKSERRRSSANSGKVALRHTTTTATPRRNKQAAVENEPFEADDNSDDHHDDHRHQHRGGRRRSSAMVTITSPPREFADEGSARRNPKGHHHNQRREAHRDDYGYCEGRHNQSTCVINVPASPSISLSAAAQHNDDNHRNGSVNSRSPASRKAPSNTSYTSAAAAVNVNMSTPHRSPRRHGGGREGGGGHQHQHHREDDEDLVVTPRKTLVTNKDDADDATAVFFEPADGAGRKGGDHRAQRDRKRTPQRRGLG